MSYIVVHGFFYFNDFFGILIALNVKSVLMDNESILTELPLTEPIGSFIILQKDIKPVLTANGAYYYYGDVCQLLDRKVAECATITEQEKDKASKRGYITGIASALSCFLSSNSDMGFAIELMRNNGLKLQDFVDVGCNDYDIEVIKQKINTENND